MLTQFLKEYVDACGKIQAQITREIGLDGGSMMKTSDAKVPLERARLLARTVGTDKTKFACLVLKTYTSEFWAVIKDLIAQDRYQHAAMVVVRKRAKSVEAEREKDATTR